ncbi:MAG TPA: hypothetical protein VGU66_07855 [Candidatus Elarobacter sp.]|nr:hypothetical protein [Candidatus Elarobacter sp.]
MTYRLPAAMLVAAMLAAPLGARAAGEADAVRPLRTLTFEVQVRVAAQRETVSDAITNLRQPGGAAPNGERHLTAKGSIGIDVVATNDDARLVLDIAETAVHRTRAKVRVAVAPDGTVFYDPKNAENLTEEELALARWLARGFYGDHPTEPGTMWTVDQSSNGYSDIEHYRVVARDAQRVTLDYSQTQKPLGTGGFAGTRGGSLVYDTALTVPVRAEFQSQSRRQIGSTNETLRTSVTLTLVTDSFAKR